MSKTALNLMLLALIPLFLLNCTEQKRPITVEEPTNSVAPALPDTAFYGHLGEGTGMSCLQIITRDGDTLTWIKTNEETGENGLILGEIENYSDSFAVTTCADNKYVAVALNICQLIGKEWFKETEAQDSTCGFLLKDGGKAVLFSNGEGKNTRYSLYNCQLILAPDEKSCGDTFNIRALSSTLLTLERQRSGDTLNFRTVR